VLHSGRLRERPAAGYAPSDVLNGLLSSTHQRAITNNPMAHRHQHFRRMRVRKAEGGKSGQRKTRTETNQVATRKSQPLILFLKPATRNTIEAKLSPAPAKPKQRSLSPREPKQRAKAGAMDFCANRFKEEKANANLFR